jgi:flagellar biosynthesis/type III secretory pathway M-ring protein FliF/YscJ
MSWLAKRLTLLFGLIASFLILLVAIINRLTIFTILKRLLIGGLIFSLLGAVIGQLISYNVSKNTAEEQSGRKEIEKAVQESSSGQQENDLEEMDLSEVDKEEENIVNLAQEEPEKVADMVKNMNQ